MGDLALVMCHRMLANRQTDELLVATCCCGELVRWLASLTLDAVTASVGIRRCCCRWHRSPLLHCDAAAFFRAPVLFAARSSEGQFSTHRTSFASAAAGNQRQPQRRATQAEQRTGIMRVGGCFPFVCSGDDDHRVLPDLKAILSATVQWS